MFNMAAHALVGCASAVANRGKCGSGALCGAAGSFAGPLLTGLSFESKLVATSVVSGLLLVRGENDILYENSGNTSDIFGQMEKGPVMSSGTTQGAATVGGRGIAFDVS